ncbi:hypothetical protein L916_14278 [Phytophthora nicotianae]|uniref:Uncharacterized protein n=1 Tax=Phytophthora nicotianae TaxID=4792 RepID=W2II88_PHYNI|nr:hypothetical protein L916_14278 [Phytophthora nicotianae]
MSLRPGDYVLLHPEDTPALQGQFQYDEVVSARRSTVTLRSVGHEPEQQYSVGRAVPRKRKVDASEAAGSRVVNYDGYDLLVGTFTGQKRVAVDHLTSEMYPVVAMIMGTRRWSSRVWPLSRLETVHDNLMDCILAGKDGFPVLPADLKEHVPQELSGISDRQVLWVDPTSGSTRTDSLSYVLRYIFYADGDAAHPQRGEVLGNSFCDEPSPSQGDNAQASPRTDFFNPLVDDDDGPVASEPQNSDGPPPQQPGLSTAIGANPLNTFVPGSRTSAASERPSTDAVGEESQDLELIDLTSRYKPHLLGFYIKQYQTSTAGTRKRLREVADAAVETPTASKRSRMAFSPSSEQDRVHLALTAPIHKVLIPTSLCLPPPAPVPQSWSQLGSAARSFAAYAHATCDSVSVQLAITVVDFIAEVEGGGGQLVEEDLPVLVWWINDGLEKYRNAVGRGIATGGNSRISLIDRFSASNPELQGLVLSVLRERLLDGEQSKTKTVSIKPRHQGHFQMERTISKDVIESVSISKKSLVVSEYGDLVRENVRSMHAKQSSDRSPTCSTLGGGFRRINTVSELPGTASGCGTALPADTSKPLDLRPAQEVGEVDTGVPNPSIVQAILETKLQAEERQRDLVISKVLSECGQSALSQLVQRRQYSLPELVELVRGQTARDRRPNKALCPKRYDLLLRGYRHQRLLQSIATDGVCPGWLRPEPHQNKRPANHHSANRNLSVEIASIRKGQDASQYLVVNRDVAALWVNVQISPFGAVAKKDVDPSVEVRLIHDLSFPVGDSTNDASDKASFPDAHYTNVAAIARRIDECGSVRWMGGYIPDCRALVIDMSAPFGWSGSPPYYAAFGGAISWLVGRESPHSLTGGKNVDADPLFPYEWVDDHVLVEADTPGRLSVASAALRLAMMAVLGPRSNNEKMFSEWSTTAEVLGLVFDMEQKTVSMPAAKLLKAQTRVNALGHRKDVSRHELECLLGSLRHVSTCLRSARPFFQRLHLACKRAHDAERYPSQTLFDST